MSAAHPRWNAIVFVAILSFGTLASLSPVAADHITDHGRGTGIVCFQNFDETDMDPDGAEYGVDGTQASPTSHAFCHDFTGQPYNPVLGPTTGDDLPMARGWGATVLVNVTDEDLTDPTWPVRVTSSSDDTGEQLILQRVIRGTRAYYHGLLGFETTSVPNNGKILVKDLDTVRVTYFDARDNTGSARIAQDVLIWNETWDGQILLDGRIERATYNFYGIQEEGEIEVRDKDLTGLSSFLVRVTSDSDPTGVVVKLSRNSEGFHRGNFLFTRGSSSVGGLGPSFGQPLPCDTSCRIQVTDGDQVHVRYALPGYDARGRTEDALVSAVWQEAYTGRIQFVSQDYRRLVSEDPRDPAAIPTLTEDTVNNRWVWSAGERTRMLWGADVGTTIGSSNAWIRVEDLDLAGRGNITVNVRSHEPNPADPPSNVDPAGVNVQLHETGFRTGEFVGHVGFVTDAASTTDCIPREQKECRLRVKEGAIVVARYDDENDAAGDFKVVEARARWNQTVTGDLRFFRTNSYMTTTDTYNVTRVANACQVNANPANTVACIPQMGFVELDDKDLIGRGTVTIRLFNNPRDFLGIPLILREVCPQGAADCSSSNPKSGVFRGEFMFNHTHSSANYRPGHDTPSGVIMPLAFPALWALCGDTVLARYEDEYNIFGKAASRFAIASITSLNCQPAQPGDRNFTVDGDTVPFPKGILLKTSGTATTSATDFFGYTTGVVQMTDWHQNRTNASVENNYRSIVVSSPLAPAAWTADSTWSWGREIGCACTPATNITAVETGPSTGVFLGQFKFVPPGAKVLATDIPVRNGDPVCAYALYQNHLGQNHTVLVHCATWHETRNASIEFRSAPHQGQRMANQLGGPAEAAVFYNGTGQRFVYNQQLNRLSTSQAWVWVQDNDNIYNDKRGKVDWACQAKAVVPNCDDRFVTVTSESDLVGIRVDITERYGRPEMDPCMATYGGNHRVFGSTHDCPGIGLDASGPGATCTDGVQGATGGYCRPTGTFDSAQDDRGWFGVFNFTTQGLINDAGKRVSDDENDNLLVKDGDTVAVFFSDPENRTGEIVTYVAYVDWNETFTGSISLGQDGGNPTVARDGKLVYRRQGSPNDVNPDPSPSNTATILVRDKDHDTGPTQQRITVLVQNDKYQCTSADPRFDYPLDPTEDPRAAPPVSENGCLQVVLEETAPSSGVFFGKFRFHPTQAAGTLTVKDGDTFTVFYYDSHDRNGADAYRLAHGQWFDRTGGRLTLDADEYVGFSPMPKITLHDPDRDRTVGPDSVNVWVWSDSDGAGEFVKLTETGGRTAIFEGTFGFETQAVLANGKIRVGDGDLVHVYMADHNTNGTVPSLRPVVKHITADWRLMGNVPPTADFRVDPLNPDAAAGMINMSRLPIVIPQGAAGNDKYAAVFNLTVLDPDTVSVREPFGNITRWEFDFGDSSVVRDSPLVTNVAGRPPLDTHLEHTYTRSGFYNATLKVWDDDGAMSEKRVPIQVVDISKARRPDDMSPGMIKVTAKVDALVLEWPALGGDTGRTDVRVGQYEVKVGAFPAEPPSNNKAFAAEPSWTDLVFRPTTFPLPAPGVNQSVEVRGLTKDTQYWIAIRARDAAIPGFDGGLFGQFAVVSGKTLFRDDTPPSPAPVITFSSHVKDLALSQNNVTFEWSESIDEESAVFYQYELSPVATLQLSDNAPTTAAQNVTLRNTPNGQYTFHLRACNMDNNAINKCSAQVSYGRIIIDKPPITTPPPPAAIVTDTFLSAYNKAINLTVTRIGKDNEILWALPTSQNQLIQPAGVQIWKRDTGGAWMPLQQFSNSTPEFQAGRYVDKNAPADRAYRVTAYFVEGGVTKGLSQNPDLPGFDQYPTRTATASASSNDGWPWWLYLILAVAALVVIGLLVLLLVTLTRNKQEDGEWDDGAEEGFAYPQDAPAEEWPSEEWPTDDAPESPEGGDVPDDAPEGGAEPDEPTEESFDEPQQPAGPMDHHLTCPNCGTGFMATGTKPLVTQCPRCGVRGILR